MDNIQARLLPVRALRVPWYLLASGPRISLAPSPSLPSHPLPPLPSPPSHYLPLPLEVGPLKSS